MKREYCGSLSGKDDGKTVNVKGWISEIRDFGKLRFILLRDITGTIQIVAHKDKVPAGIFDAMAKVTEESSVSVSGEVKESKQAPGGREIVPEKFELVAKSDPLPIDVKEWGKTEISKRLDYRFLDFHNPKVQAVFKIQSEIAHAFREFFKDNEFIEIQPPCIIASASEGGTELFPVMYFDKHAFLAQSPQLYKQMATCSFEKVTMITPVWRAEKHNTTRHLNEIRQMDIEVAFADEFEVMKYLEDVVRYIIGILNQKCKKELEILDMKLKVPDSKYINYAETVKLLKKKKVKINYGDDIPPEGEKKLCELFPDSIVFVHDWPLDLKPFYIMPKTLNKNEKTSRGFDAIYGGIEISSGGQRIHLPELLIERLKAKGLNPKSFEKYIDSFRYGAPPHAGWSIGLERMTAIVTGQENIREACMFPRDRDRLTP
jgi:aspartyl-tRNA synthetase